MAAPSRLIIMAKPPAATLAAMVQVLRERELEQQLGAEMFDPANWHQSFSDRFPDSPEFRASLKRACGQVVAEPFVLSLNRIGGTEGHWEFRVRGRPKGFTALLTAIRAALRAERITDVEGNSPHVRISDRAPASLPSTPIVPIDWRIDELLLVRGGGDPYRYETLGRWPFAGTAAAQSPQMGWEF